MSGSPALSQAVLPADDAEIERLPEAARAIVRRLGMRKIPHEGPWFIETYRSPDLIEGGLARRYPSPRIAATAIIALLTEADFSAFHRLATDEIWHFYAGDPLDLHLLGAGAQAAHVRLGPDLLAGQTPQTVVPAGVYMAARPAPGGSSGFSLIGNTLAPGFEFEDYEGGDRDALMSLFPVHRDLILRHTRATDHRA